MFHVEQERGAVWTPGRFQQEFAVADATMDKMQRYAALLTQWQQKMNLVGPATLADLWGRHFADSAQLLRHAPPAAKWLDIGAGGGFPGMLLAILGVGQMVLVESIAKKARFLQAVCDDLGLGRQVSVQCGRIEQLPPQEADVISARAVAALDRLLGWSLPHVAASGMLLFPKGKRWNDEVGQARRRFCFDLAVLPSMTDVEARILRVRQLARR